MRLTFWIYNQKITSLGQKTTFVQKFEIFLYFKTIKLTISFEKMEPGLY